MSPFRDCLEVLAREGKGMEPVPLPCRALEEGLSRVETLAELRAHLGASSLLLQAGAQRGDLVLVDLAGALARARAPALPAAGGALIGLGKCGRAVLARLRGASMAPAARFLFELEGACAEPESDGASAIAVIALDGAEVGGGQCAGESLDGAYRALTSGKGLPPVLKESLPSSASGRGTAHVIAGLEGPWLMLLPALLFDLWSHFERGKRGRTILHLLSRPLGRGASGARRLLEELEKSAPFDEAFILCHVEEVLSRQAAAMIELSAPAPELLSRPAARRRGPFSSYGTAPAPAFDERGERAYLERFEDAFQAASPSWKTGHALLEELVLESVFLTHPPEAPPPPAAWKLCPDLMPLSVSGASPTLCRIQRGLKLVDLRSV